ncbi:hypothetical protein TNCT_511651 [Trichonephila clavata]|uniref:Uncharacterized protein n=1 Tax=Trichonephila clavata TaxID=2740835 RepID=A0A8X6G1N7_TRICU|nr:hypothetical protein TNCT_511651 [Trichonephila clavata]
MFLDQTVLSIAVANGEDEKLHYGTLVSKVHRNRPDNRQEVEFFGLPVVRDFVHPDLRKRVRVIFWKEQLGRTRLCGQRILQWNDWISGADVLRVQGVRGEPGHTGESNDAGSSCVH